MDGVVSWTAFPGDAGLEAEQLLLDMRDRDSGRSGICERWYDEHTGCDQPAAGCTVGTGSPTLGTAFGARKIITKI